MKIILIITFEPGKFRKVAKQFRTNHRWEMAWIGVHLCTLCQITNFTIVFVYCTLLLLIRVGLTNDKSQNIKFLNFNSEIFQLTWAKGSRVTFLFTCCLTLSVRLFVIFTHFWLLLKNHWPKFYQTWYKSFLWEGVFWDLK